MRLLKPRGVFDWVVSLKTFPIHTCLTSLSQWVPENLENSLEKMK